MILFLPFSEKNYFQNIPPFYPIINLFKGSKPRAQLSSLLFNYSTQGRGSKSRNRNNKVLKCRTLIRFYIPGYGADEKG